MKGEYPEPWQRLLIVLPAAEGYMHYRPYIIGLGFVFRYLGFKVDKKGHPKGVNP